MKRRGKQQPPQGYTKVCLSPHDVAELKAGLARFGDFEPCLKHWVRIDAIMAGLLLNCSDRQLIQLGACVVEEALGRGVDCEMLARALKGFAPTRTKPKERRKRNARALSRRLAEEHEERAEAPGDAP